MSFFAFYILPLNSKGVDNNTTNIGFNAQRIYQIPDITYTEYIVSWRIFHVTSPRFQFSGYLELI